ncbi:MAG: hypothetical protein P8177_04250 [Gemmatimonadota bacterium]|jgi:Spy/CpxP family protein refolding chaperone
MRRRAGIRGPASLAALGVALLLTAPAAAQHGHPPSGGAPGSDPVRTLTGGEAARLLEGAGMGLARPAELNGYPGPRHVLEHADALELTDPQRERAQAIFDEMHEAAVSLGARIVAAEQELDRAFGRRAGAPGLEHLVTEIARLRGQLRWVHLRAHMEMTPVLTDAQRAEYVRLRGAGSGAPGSGQR